MDNMQRMKELIPLLTEAAKAYYQEDREIMSNFEYDRLYDELVKLEEETGVTLAGSPTVSVGYASLEELPKEAHESPMLSRHFQILIELNCQCDFHNSLAHY